MDNNYFKAKVIKIEEEAVYQNVIYTQSVTLELGNGQQLTFFDPSFHTKGDMINKKVKVKASVLTQNFEKNSKKKTELYQTVSTNAKISGKIISEEHTKAIFDNTQHSKYLLDARYAKFSIHSNNPLNLKKGE